MQQVRLHQILPSSLTQLVAKMLCSKCDELIQPHHIVGIGIREFSKQLDVYLEYECGNCGHSALLRTPHKAKKLDDLCYFLLEQHQKKEKCEIARTMEQANAPKGPMTDDEVKQFIKFLNKSDDHSDFMKHIRRPHSP